MGFFSPGLAHSGLAGFPVGLADALGNLHSLGGDGLGLAALALGAELVVPKGVAVVLAVGLDLMVCPARDHFQPIQGDIGPLVESVSQDADNPS